MILNKGVPVIHMGQYSFYRGSGLCTVIRVFEGEIENYVGKVCAQVKLTSICLCQGSISRGNSMICNDIWYKYHK